MLGEGKSGKKYNKKRETFLTQFLILKRDDG